MDWQSRLAAATVQYPSQDSDAIGWATEVAQPQNACLFLHKALDFISRHQKSVEECNYVQPASLAHCSRLGLGDIFFLPLFCLGFV